MTPEWTLVEPCCGTAALAMYLLGSTRQLCPRQGSKWNFRRILEERTSSVTLGRPARVVLSDASPWALVVRSVLADREALLVHLRSLVDAGGCNPELVYANTHGAPVPADTARMAAELLWLQRMAYAGKAVRVVDGRWSAPGLNLTSAHGVAETEKFGAVRPLGPALLRSVEAAPRFDAVDAFVGLARPEGPVENTVVYLDPPYAKTTSYGSGDLTRAETVALAVEWEQAGASVFVSEATAVDELVALGWNAVPIGTIGTQRPTQLFRAKHRGEWITWRAQARQLGLFGVKP